MELKPKNHLYVVLWWLTISNIFIGSGKRALFEVISRRAQGPTRGQILLNGVPMSMRLFQVWIHELYPVLDEIFYSPIFLLKYLQCHVSKCFQESCGYVAQKCDLLPGLTVRQTLHYAAALTIGSKVMIRSNQ